MSTSEHYDVVVLGRTTASLLAAALLAKRRYRVRVFDVAGSDEQPNQPLYGFDTCPLLDRIQDELGLKHAVRTRLSGPPGGITIALPDRRFALPATAAEKGEILSEVFPGDTDGVVGLFEYLQTYGQRLDPILDGELEIPPEGFRGRRAWKRALSDHDLHGIPGLDEHLLERPAIRQLVSTLLTVAGQGSDDLSLSTPATVRAIWHLCHGITKVQDGRVGLDRLITEKLLTIGGTVEERRVASHLEVRRGKARAVFAEDGARFGADMFIVAGGEPALSQLWDEAPLPDGQQGRRFRIEVNRSHRPEGLMDPCGWLATQDGEACGVRVDGDAIELTLVNGANLPDLETLMPFSNARVGDPAEIQLPTSDRIDDLGLFHHPIKSSCKNVLFVGSWVMPGLGIETDCATAWHATRLIEKSGPGRWRPGSRA